MTANEAYTDASLRHLVALRRYSVGLNKQIAKILESADRDLTKKLRERLKRFEGKPVDFTGERWRLLLREIGKARAVSMSEYTKLTRSEMLELVGDEATREISLLSTAIPIAVNFATVSPSQLRAIALSKPFQGKILRTWFDELSAADKSRITQQIQIGIVEGESINNIVKRIAGTRKNGYADGVLSITRRNAQAIARTAVNHIANSAKVAVWDENADIVTAMVWTATLDGRTSAICRLNDGRGKPTTGNTLPKELERVIPPGATLPAHYNERSVWVGYIDGESLLGERPFVVDTRTPEKREIDFRAEAKRKGVSIQTVRRMWADENIGRVPGKTDYEQFLRRQDATFQNEVLGVEKGKLFRSGGLTLRNFYDRAGNELTLAELRGKFPGAFKEPLSEVDKWDDSAFKNTSGNIEKILENAILKNVTNNDDGAFFSAGEALIEMGTHKRGDLHGDNIYRHERGHSIDYNLRSVVDEDYYRSSSPDWVKSMAKDSRVVNNEKNKISYVRRNEIIDNFESVPSEKKEKLIQKQFKNSGLDYKGTLSYLKNETTILDGISLSERQEMLFSLAKFYELKEVEWFIKVLTGLNLKYATRMSTYKKGGVGTLSDMVGAITNNKRCSYPEFAGHSKSYYKQRKQYYSGQGTEAFANMTAAYYGKETLPVQFAEHFFPETSNLYKKIMGIK